MERTMSATEARVHFGEVLDFVSLGRGTVTVERAGNPVAVVISPKLWAEFAKHHKDDPWERAERVLRDGREYLAERYGSGKWQDVDVDAVIDEDREERDRAILGDLLR